MARWLTVLAVLVLAAGCGSPADDPATGMPGGLSVEWVSLGDGTEVRCVAWKYMNAGGLSCDWNNVRTVGNG